MALPDTRTIVRVALWLALAYAAALAGPPLYAAFARGGGGTLGGALLAVTWTAAPVYVAAAFVGASPGHRGAWLFLALELALIASFAWQFAGSRHSSTGGFIFFGWPMIQWAAIILVFMIALAFGWRMRPDFLRD
jgi:hypothetical protein